MRSGRFWEALEIIGDSRRPRRFKEARDVPGDQEGPGDSGRPLRFQEAREVREIPGDPGGQGGPGDSEDPEGSRRFQEAREVWSRPWRFWEAREVQ